MKQAKRNLHLLNFVFVSLLLLFGFCSMVLLVNLGLIPNIPELKLPVSTPLIPTQVLDQNNRSGPRGLLLKSSPTPRPELSATQSPTPTLVTPTSHPTATPGKTIQPPTATPALAEKVELDTRFGGEQKFVIHRVVSGESISLFATQYSSSVEVIQWANYRLAAPLQTEIQIVIPVDRTVIDPEMPAFEAYQVKSNSLQAQDLAEDLETDLDEFLYYNNLDGDHLLPFGTWLIIPRSAPMRVPETMPAILFVCLANQCRSPIAAVTFRAAWAAIPGTKPIRGGQRRHLDRKRFGGGARLSGFSPGCRGRFAPLPHHFHSRCQPGWL